jgi:hypothetical protein
MNNMNISKQEAADSLDQIEDAISRTQNAIGQGASGGILILWGIIWALGFSADQFAPRMAQTFWPFLIAGGMLAAWLCRPRSKSRARSLIGARIGLFWLVLFAYAVLWFFLLHSESRPGQPGLHFEALNGHEGEAVEQQLGAFFATVPMFAYVAGGIWLGRFFVWLGAVVTALTIAGYCLMPDWFNLWMAITGGGSLVVAGLYIRRFWRQDYGPA